MAELELSQGLKTIVDDEDYERIIAYKTKWYARKCSNKTYAACSNPDNWKTKTYLHRFIMGFPEGMFVDHINGDSLDNRKENLRVCTRKENLRNKANVRKKKVNGKYKGVQFIGEGRDLKKPWTVRLSFEGENMYFGCFETEEEAAKVYDEMASKYYGEFANLNFERSG